MQIRKLIPIFIFSLCMFPGIAPAANPENWSLHFQTTNIGKTDAPFHAAYSGKNSLRSHGEIRETVTSTLFLGRRLWPGGEFYFNPELSQLTVQFTV